MISARVSWIKVRAKENPNSYPEAQGSSICFVNGYAPTETGSKVSEVEEFYDTLRQAFGEAQKAAGSPGAVVLGDFNIHLGDNNAGHGSLGGCLPPGPSIRHSLRFLEFCELEGLAVSQTFQDKSRLKQGISWSTWRHPRTGNPHRKDLILVPK